MMQVSYFKLTKEFTPDKPMLPIMVAWHKLTHKLPGEGKRIFRMAPLHHHFEAVMAERNTGEASVVSMFWLAQALLCAAILSAFFLSGAKL
jgi:phospho-N-acetylmuramoyl-pentapeptide-transferase